MKNGFDFISSSYDRAAKIFFGNDIKKAQCHYITNIPEGATILILGGGTGWILNEIFNRRSSVNIIYVDTSERMIAKAKKTVDNKWLSQLIFINDTYQSVDSKVHFDIIFTPFFLDMFKENDISVIINDLSIQLTENGAWINTDFTNTTIWYQKIVVKMMYIFFRVVCGISAMKLPNFEKIFKQNGFLFYRSAFFHNGMIKSIIYKKR
ncbi:MAG: class I SAM-dependent methyltransferase [Cyclobacteriaceae bacterium]|nr:class I SAM-dependent methyltransferase [Cyclobacteriaceae bacterium]